MRMKELSIYCPNCGVEVGVIRIEYFIRSDGKEVVTSYEEVYFDLAEHDPLCEIEYQES